MRDTGPVNIKHTLLMVGKFGNHAKATPQICTDLASRLESSGWTVLTTSDKAKRLPLLLDMLATLSRQRCNYEVAHVDVFSGLAFVWAEAVCIALRLLAKPYILTLHGGNLPAFARRWPRRVQNLLGSAVMVTTPSHYLREQMKDYRGDLVFQPNPIDLTAYDFQLRSRPRPKLVWLRRFCEIYNPTLAPKVVALLAKDFPQLDLTMIGPDWGDGSLLRTQSVATDLGVWKRIRLFGRVAKWAVSRSLNEGDIFLNTTNFDNTPISVLEAMACGLCIVSTNVGGLPYLLEHERDALLVPPDNPPLMAQAVQRILSEPGLAAFLSSNARRKAEQFDWSLILPRWEQLLARAITGKADAEMAKPVGSRNSHAGMNC